MAIALAIALLLGGLRVEMIEIVEIRERTGELENVAQGRVRRIRNAGDLIEAEVQGLAELYRTGGLTRLSRVIEVRSVAEPERGSIYLLIDPFRAPIAGNIDEWPQVRTSGDGWLRFAFVFADYANLRPIPTGRTASAGSMPPTTRLLDTGLSRRAAARLKLTNGRCYRTVHPPSTART